MMKKDASGRCKTFKPKMLQRPYQGHSLGFILQCKVGQRRTMPARFTMRARAYNVTATALRLWAGGSWERLIMILWPHVNCRAQGTAEDLNIRGWWGTIVSNRLSILGSVHISIWPFLKKKIEGVPSSASPGPYTYVPGHPSRPETIHQRPTRFPVHVLPRFTLFILLSIYNGVKDFLGALFLVEYQQNNVSLHFCPD